VPAHKAWQWNRPHSAAPRPAPPQDLLQFWRKPLDYDAKAPGFATAFFSGKWLHRAVQYRMLGEQLDIVHFYRQGKNLDADYLGTTTPGCHYADGLDAPDEYQRNPETRALEGVKGNAARPERFRVIQEQELARIAGRPASSLEVARLLKQLGAGEGALRFHDYHLWPESLKTALPQAKVGGAAQRDSGAHRRPHAAGSAAVKAVRDCIGITIAHSHTCMHGWAPRCTPLGALPLPSLWSYSTVLWRAWPQRGPIGGGSSTAGASSHAPADPSSRTHLRTGWMKGVHLQHSWCACSARRLCLHPALGPSIPPSASVLAAG
jgi:hypothetical protein